MSDDAALHEVSDPRPRQLPLVATPLRSVAAEYGSPLPFGLPQTYARRRRRIQWSSSFASVLRRPGRKYPAQPRSRLLSSPTIFARLTPLSRAVISRTFFLNRLMLSGCIPVRVFPMKRVIRKPRYLLCHGQPTALFFSLTDSLSLSVMKRLTECLTRSAALSVRTYTDGRIAQRPDRVGALLISEKKQNVRFV